MEPRKFKDTLQVRLKHEERDDLTEDIVNLDGRKTEVEDAKKSALDSFKSQLSEIGKEYNEAIVMLRRNWKYAEVDCEEYLDEETEQVVTRRMDTNEIINVRGLTEKERQQKLVFDLEQVEDEYVRKDDLLFKMLTDLTEKEVLDREVTEEEIKNWKLEEFQLVERWAMLRIFADQKTQENVGVGELPQILAEKPEAKEKDDDPDAESEKENEETDEPGEEEDSDSTEDESTE